MFYFRADASSEIGTGHVMRCLAIAEELISRGKKASFVCEQIPNDLVIKLDEKNIPLLKISPPAKVNFNANDIYSRWLTASEEDDAQACLKVMTDIEGVFVDHYAIGKTWEELILKRCQNLMVMDDLCNRPHHCQNLVDYNVYAGEKDYSRWVSKTTSLLTGSLYAPIRRDLQALRPQVKNHRGQVKSVVISFGGADQAGHTLRAVEGLAQAQLRPEKVRVILNPSSPTQAAVQSLCEKMGYKLSAPTANIGQVLLESDLALGAGGVSQVERSFLGVPSLITFIAENQALLSQSMSALGICKLLGDGSAMTAYSWAQEIDIHSQNFEWLTVTQTKGLQLFDGQGCARIVNSFTALQS